MEKVSIILPVYNSEKYIEETIKSVLNQTYTNWELIIVDDCSKDNSLKIVEQLKTEQFRIIKNKENSGVALSRNKAIEKAQGKYIAFIDSDDLWEKEKLEKQLKFMEERNIVFSFSSYKRIKENGNIITKVNVPNKIDYKELLKNTIILTSTVIIDTEKISKDLIKMPKLKLSEDTAMFLNILRNGYTAYGLEEYLIKYRVRKKSLSSNKLKSMHSLWKVYKNQEKLNFFERVKNILGYIKNATKKRIPSRKKTTDITIKKQISNPKLKRLGEIFHYLSLKQIIDVFLFPFIWLISKIIKPFCPKDIWIIEENPNEACDNGYIFFKYLRENRKDINVFYVIKKKSKDYKKVEVLGNIIQHGRLKHWIYYLTAKRIIITQKYSNPSRALFYILHNYNIIKTPRIFLQHGITKDDCKLFYYNRTKYRLFICGAKREYEYIKEKFGYTSKNVVYTGFARFDNLDVCSSSIKQENYKENIENRQILIAPTWRNWIKTQKQFDEFMQNYYKLLNNEKLSKCLENGNIQLKLVLHKNMKKFKIKDLIFSKNINIYHNEEIEIQELINKTDLLITDFSSIFFDIAYRKRPIIYYQFDKNKYRENQLQEGYFSYENDGFGDIFDNVNLVVEKIKDYIENNFEVEEKYSKRMDEFFERKDKNNCKRILEEIEKL